MRIRVSLLAIGFVLFVLPLTAFAAVEGEGGWGWYETIGRWINLTILFGMIAYFTRDAIKKFFSNRREGIQFAISDAEKARENAERELASMKETFESLDQELEELRKEAQHEAETERKRIIEQAEQEASKIIASAEREIEGLTRAARQDLRAFAATLSIDLARQRIESELDDQAREKIVDRFFIQLSSGDRTK